MATAAELRFNVDDPPLRVELHSSRQKLKDVLHPSYWESLCPGLHCGNQQFVAKMKAIDVGKHRLADLKQQINTAGVAQVASTELPWSVQPEQLAAAVVSLIRHGWPPSLLIMYDEVWAVIQQASGLMRDATGGNACNMDILAWYVDPARGAAGFSPHRDRQPDDTPATFRPDGTAMYATLWLPLTDATPENSCLYVIPRFADPGYYDGDPDEDDAPDPLTAALPSKEAYQHIRALPCKAGSACLFTHRTIHWGSKGRPGCPTPRISISWGCADDAFEPAYFSRSHLPCPPVELRLALAGAQMIVYHERFPAPAKQLRLYYQAFSSQTSKFDSTYGAKVKREFLDASKEATAALTPAAATAAAGTAVVNGAAVGARKGRSKATADTAKPATILRNDDDEKQQQQGSSKRRRKVTQAAAAVVAAEKLAGKQQQQQQQPASKGKKATPSNENRTQLQRNSKNAAAAEAAAQQPPLESEDDNDGIDWAKVTAAAKEAARKAKERRKGKKGVVPAAAGDSSDDSDGGLGFGSDEDDTGDVMDLALDAVLDAQLAGEDFHDDFDEE